MMGFTPADVSAAQTLLAIIADPAKAKAALDALVSAKAALEKAAAEAKSVEDSALRHKSEASDAMNRVQKATDEHQSKVAGDRADLKSRSTALDNLKATLTAAKDALEFERSEHDEQVAAAFKALDQAKTTQDQREKEIVEREAALAEREIATADAETRAAALLAEYQNKLTALKQLTG